MNLPAVHFEEKRSKDLETEAILEQARQVVLVQFPEREQEFETHLNAVSKAASTVRTQIIILSVISFFKNLIGRSSTSEAFQLN
jgi:hypothetical protein